MTQRYHTPVMLNECITGLDIKPDGVYVDLTFGGGGHTQAILEKIEGGHLYSFDQDQDARANAQQIDKRSFTFIEGNFRHLKRYLKMHRIQWVDGILGDLGISSHQIDDASRGFSTRFEAELDMRMDQSATTTARDVLNKYPERELHRIFGMYGEVKNARTLAAAVIAGRTNAEITTINELREILSRYVPRGKENKYYAQVFQAIRIEVNEELKALEDVLDQSVEMLKPGGRLVIMSYHSLEDRMVKHFMTKGKIKGEVEKDFYGNVIRPLRPVNRKPIVAGETEISQNKRARSAKLRIAEKI